MKILGGMLPDYWEGCIPPWICTHGYEEVRNYRKTLFIQSIVENGWWGEMHPPHPSPWIRSWYAKNKGVTIAAGAVLLQAPAQLS